METRTVGRSGLRTSLLGLGCNNFGWWIDRASSLPVLARALDLGITTFDTADVYGADGASERILGEALGARRKDVVIITKSGWAPDPADRDVSRRHLLQACEASLRRLGTDWIDLYLMHAPDLSTPIDETLRAMDDLVRAGKVRYVGCSNTPPWRIVDAHWSAATLRLNHFIASQDEYSLLARGAEAERLPALAHLGMGLIPFFPLANGLLTGKYRSVAEPPGASRLAKLPFLATAYLTEANLDKVRRLEAFAAERGHDLVELALSWLAACRAVPTIIAGATTPAQLERNVTATAWALSAQELAAIDAITKP